MVGSRSALPRSLKRHARWMHLAGVPALLMHPELDLPAQRPLPFLLWLHGRTANKELDNSRYLRLLRAGIACVALDLPGHGEREEAAMQTSAHSMQVIERMLQELPAVLQDLAAEKGFDLQRVAIGGMSLGGMIALARLCQPHHFCAALLEATTGDFTHLESAQHDPRRADALEPARHLDRWQPTPVLALHAQYDDWIHIAWQREFMERLSMVNGDMATELVVYPRTGAPHEHIGFGTFAAQSKDAGIAFLLRHLRPEPLTSPR